MGVKQTRFIQVDEDINEAKAIDSKKDSMPRFIQVDTPPSSQPFTAGLNLPYGDRQTVETAVLKGETRVDIIGLAALKDVARNTSNSKVHSILATHSDSAVRAALARNPKLHARILSILVNDAAESVRRAALAHKRYKEIANYALLDSVSQGKSINWATDMPLIEDMYKANYNGRKDKYDFSRWPEGWIETLARFTTNDVVQVALCREPYSVRVALANNVKPSLPLLYKLASDNSKAVLKAFLSRTDLDRDLRKLAEEKLRQLDIQKHQVRSDNQFSQLLKTSNSAIQNEDLKNTTESNNNVGAVLGIVLGIGIFMLVLVIILANC